VVSGSAGCSAYEGTYAVDESAEVSIADLTAEEIGACDPLVEQWQLDYPPPVDSVDEASRDGERLVLGIDPWAFDLDFDPAH
jgi:hypothetical protein